MTYRIDPTIDGQWRFGTRVYQTFIEARRALTQTSRRLRKERRGLMAQAHFSKTNLSLSLYRNSQLSLRSTSAMYRSERIEIKERSHAANSAF
jgi:hypothetical protein